MREHYRLATLEDVLLKLANARIFSKLDIREEYWHVKLGDSQQVCRFHVSRHLATTTVMFGTVTFLF
jgi:hypothetical protein